MRKWFQQIAPDRDRLVENRWLRPLARRLEHPSIWQFNRRNVARGVALGLFAGFIIPIGQVFLAALFAATVRGNLLVAAAATLVTNPITSPPIIYAAYRFGSFLLGTSATSRAVPAFPTSGESLMQLLSGASLPTVLGMVLLALIAATVGFFAVHLAWGMSLRIRWRNRTRRQG